MNVAVIFAGGSGLRMKSSATPKQFLPFAGKPILIHTLEHFQKHPAIDAISLAILPAWHDDTKEMAANYEITKLKWLVEGGATGQRSIYNALKAIESAQLEATEKTGVLMHDGVRPLINAQLISRVLAQLHRSGTAVTTYPTVETSIISTDGCLVDSVLSRSQTFIAQAPQAFYLAPLLHCHEQALAQGKEDFIDSCSLYQAYRSDPICMVEGARSNIKITTPEDYHTLQALYDL